MDKAEQLIKKYLKMNMDINKVGDAKYCASTPDCLDEGILLDYLMGSLGQEERRAVEYHIVGCSFCLSQLDIAHQAQLKSGQDDFEPIPQELINKTKASLGISAAKSSNKPKIGLRRIFLAGAVIFFAMSFIIPKYFLQFLVATLILGLRWAFESEGGRTLVMVLDSWRHHSQDKDQETSNRLKNHL